MKLEWMGEYRELIEKLICYCNRYAQSYNIELNFNTPVDFSFAQLQVMEYILENEERRENMAAIAARLGVSPSAFSKNIKKMMSKGLLVKYHSRGNKKDIIICVSDLGREVYEQYAQYMYAHGFGSAFRILDEIPKEYIDKFTMMLSGASNGTAPVPKELEPLIKIE